MSKLQGDEVSRYISEEDILAEVESVISGGAVPSGRAARDYYSSGDLPYLIERYFRQRGLHKRYAQAKALGVSQQTLNKIFAGSDISENMLFRFRNAIHRATLRKYYPQNQVDEILRKPWRLRPEIEAGDSYSQLVVLIRSTILSFESSNYIGSDASPLNELQKNQLVCLLRELLAKLEAPLVNVEEAEKTNSRIGAAIRRGVDRSVENASQKTTDKIVSETRRFIARLLEQKGISSITDFFT